MQQPEQLPKMEYCPNCQYALVRRTTYCPFCGFQLTHPLWKKVAAWILLVLIAYGLVKCHLRMLDGFDISGENQKLEPAPATDQGGR